VNVILMGPPGSGKGTQAEILADAHDIWHVSTGNILRGIVKDGLAVGSRKIVEGQVPPQEGHFTFSHHIADILSRGELVPDDMMIDLMRHTLINMPKDKKGWLLDGFPRTHVQAVDLSKMLIDLECDAPVVIDINVEDDEIVRRLSGRLTCKDCGHVGRLRKAESTGICSKCEGPLYERDDDKAETVRKRLQVFREKTQPALDVLKKQFTFTSVDGTGNLDDVTKRISSALKV
jgi:adenylate kinase